MCVGVGVSVGVDVSVAVGVAVGVGLDVAVGVGEAVSVGVGVARAIDKRVGEGTADVGMNDLRPQPGKRHSASTNVAETRFKLKAIPQRQARLMRRPAGSTTWIGLAA